MPNTYSISVRVKRTTVDYAYIKVLVATNVMQTNEAGELVRDEKGSTHLDGKKVFEEALRLAPSSSEKWFREDEIFEPHPIQKAPEPNER